MSYMAQKDIEAQNKRLTRKCPKCGYEWVSRKETPKACPRCKTRLDWR